VKKRLKRLAYIKVIHANLPRKWKIILASPLDFTINVIKMERKKNQKGKTYIKNGKTKLNIRGTNDPNISQLNDEYPSWTNENH